MHGKSTDVYMYVIYVGSVHAYMFAFVCMYMIESLYHTLTAGNPFDNQTSQTLNHKYMVIRDVCLPRGLPVDQGTSNTQQH